eukprot:7572350-Lingulodinium_polyedra.AAC.1
MLAPRATNLSKCRFHCLFTRSLYKQVLGGRKVETGSAKVLLCTRVCDYAGGSRGQGAKFLGSLRWLFTSTNAAFLKRRSTVNDVGVALPNLRRDLPAGRLCLTLVRWKVESKRPHRGHPVQLIS